MREILEEWKIGETEGQWPKPKMMDNTKSEEHILWCRRCWSEELVDKGKIKMNHIIERKEW